MSLQRGMIKIKKKKKTALPHVLVYQVSLVIADFSSFPQLKIQLIPGTGVQASGKQTGGSCEGDKHGLQTEEPGENSEDCSY